MPKVADIKAYWRDIATKAGLGEDELKQVTAVLDNDKFAKAFTDGFKPLPDYSHDLDNVRANTKAEKDKEYDSWFKAEQTKYQEYVSGLDRLRAYESQFGPIENPTFNQNLNQGATMTKEEIDRIKAEMKAELDADINNRLSRRDRATLDLMDVRESHMSNFKKTLDVQEFEKAWAEHPEWGGSLKLAYSQYVAPEVEKFREVQVKADSDRRYEEGVRDGFSRRAVPSDHQPKTFSPLFDRKEDVAKLGDHAQESHSREAFFEGLRDQKQPV